MGFYIVGTAGHIDHGKSTLVKTLTGVDPDRFAEEKRRGMTIDLGFAHLALPSGNEIGFVDVPGHEKFIRNMLAGAAGIDVVILVVAADEGIMPQTQEHFEILNLLGVKTGFIVLTKIDLVEDATWLELIETELREEINDSFLANAPIIRFSAKTGEGKEEIIKALDNAVKEAEPKKIDLPARFPVDWVFSKPGFGTVVRGTLWEGEVFVDQQLLLLPQNEMVRIRGVQSFGQNLNKGIAGQRLALNLASIAKYEVKRGDVLVEQGFYRPTSLIDCQLTLLPKSFKLKQGEEILFYLGTKETTAKIRLLESDEARPATTYFVQFRLAEPVVARRGDHFIIRRTSPLRTIGGGKIINPYPPPRHRFRQDILMLLDRLNKADDKAFCLETIKERNIIEKSELNYYLANGQKKTEEIVSSLLKEGKILEISPFLILAEEFNAKLNKLVHLLEENQKNNPANPYLSKEVLRGSLKIAKPILEKIIKKLENEGKIETLDEKIKLKKEEAITDIRTEVEKIFLENLFLPPTPQEVAAKFPGKQKEAEQMVYRLVNEKVLMRIGSFYFHQKAIEKAKALIGEKIKASGPQTASEIKDLLGSTRKFVIPLLEYLDRLRFTRRIGDKRELSN